MGHKNSTGRTYPFPEADPVSAAGADRGVECGRVLLPALDAVEGEGLTGVTTTLAVACIVFHDSTTLKQETQFL